MPQTSSRVIDRPATSASQPGSGSQSQPLTPDQLKEREHSVILSWARAYAVDGRIAVSQLETILRDLRAFGLPNA